MKIAVVHNIPIHYKHLLFRAMKAEGLDFEVLFLASGSTIRHEEIPLSQELYRHRIGHDGPYEEAPPLRKALWTWLELQDARPKLILVSSYYATECWSAWLWALVRRVPIVMWYESNEFDYPRHWPKELLKRIFVRGLAGAQVYGSSNKAYLVKLGLKSEDVAIKGAVADIEKFDTKPDQKVYRPEGVTRLLYVGRLTEIKNLTTLIRAFAAAVENAAGPLKLILAGVGPCETSLRKTAGTLGIADLVEFKGYVPQKDLASIYRQADFFILPSVREPWGLVALEAMLCRVPVLLSTQCGCAADVVRPETGWTFSPWSEEQLVGLIRALPAIPNGQMRQMGNAAHDLAVNYSPENCAHVVASSIRHLKDRSCRVGSAIGSACAT